MQNSPLSTSIRGANTAINNILILIKFKSMSRTVVKGIRSLEPF